MRRRSLLKALGIGAVATQLPQAGKEAGLGRSVLPKEAKADIPAPAWQCSDTDTGLYFNNRNELRAVVAGKDAGPANA